ncbi:type II secretion system F family protein [Methylobacterium nodulans]|uniref:Type II secretion system protein n=1 Tax=Methylobacterium nodulans (strain LMG 21967 / CNCM I-2342 / ORS 2060) TaxID=460265 RepID=B8IDY9_METNO|nr:type II secretion system F family protein [Methylobacterium nodulans]ACL57535.1 type II secretion system protein [Methylobacterium nodulans ORS 2060]
MGQRELFWMVSAAVFLSVAALTYLSTTYVGQRGTVRQRMRAARRTSEREHTPYLPAERKGRLEAIFGVNESTIQRQRLDLLRGGFFNPNAVEYFNFTKLTLVFALPICACAMFAFRSDLSSLTKFALVSGSLLLAYYIPDAFVSRRQRLQKEAYRSAFPDMLDLLVVCVDAGLSLEAAFDRVGSEMDESGALRVNLAIMASELRNGRGFVDGLQGLAERLDIDEARSFAILLQQSLELGTDISQSLRVYSDEMRNKRMMRAEEKANALPVKIVLPLGAFIFPVILIVVMVPIVIRIIAVLGRS